MGPAKRPRSRAEIRGKVLDVGRPRKPPEVTTAEQACEEPPFDVSWTRVRFPPPPPKKAPRCGAFLFWWRWRESSPRDGAGVAAPERVRARRDQRRPQPARKGRWPHPGTCGENFILSAFCFFVLVKAVQVEPSGWRSRLTRACALPLGPRPRGVGTEVFSVER